MAVPQELIDAMDLVDKETTEIAAVVIAQRDKIKTSMSPTDVTAVKDRLTAVGARLDAVAKDPDNPVPPGPPPAP